MLNGDFRPWALIPAKRFARAKKRLGSVLDNDARRALARALLERVLRASRSAGELEGLLVVTDGDDAAALGKQHGAHALFDRQDRAGTLFSQVIDDGLDWLRVRGATHALVLMADLPLIQARDVRELLAVARAHAVVIAPDNARRGTNALALALDLEFPTAFGHADSLERHLAIAEHSGAHGRVLVHPRLGLDLDSPQDLERFDRGFWRFHRK